MARHSLSLRREGQIGHRLLRIRDGGLRQVSGHQLPRNSAKQAEACRPIKRSELQPGDLVFFHARGSRRVSHVGLYVGEGCMLHASSSQGVMVSRLSDPYWERAYHSAGRVGQFEAMMRRELR